MAKRSQVDEEAAALQAVAEQVDTSICEQTNFKHDALPTGIINGSKNENRKWTKF